MSWAIWITGPPGSGKTALTMAVARALAARGIPVKVLELDALRKILTPKPTYRDDEREIVYRALVSMAMLLTEAGVPVLIDATGHRRAWRELARERIPCFAEVQLACPLEVCREREQARRWGHAPRGVYDQAGAAGARVPGVDVPYEGSFHPELSLDTHTTNPWTQVQEVLHLARRLVRQAALRHHRIERRIICESANG